MVSSFYEEVRTSTEGRIAYLEYKTIENEKNRQAWVSSEVPRKIAEVADQKISLIHPNFHNDLLKPFDKTICNNPNCQNQKRTIIEFSMLIIHLYISHTFPTSTYDSLPNIPGSGTLPLSFVLPAYSTLHKYREVLGPKFQDRVSYLRQTVHPEVTEWVLTPLLKWLESNRGDALMTVAVHMRVMYWVNLIKAEETAGVRVRIHQMTVVAEDEVERFLREDNSREEEFYNPTFGAEDIKEHCRTIVAELWGAGLQPSRVAEVELQA
ncbi:hypothetical protein AAF712_015457 [Marasmius tenuissimus]|uniref:Uncharacterized protein n=1 Tax=Marasmius tenuissimus TaxID=585030 RepID=A0ABR2Z877_9AGAR